MNNRQLYKSTFSKLHTDCELNWEATKMETKKRIRCSRRFIIVSLVLVLMLAMTCMVNAASGGQLMNDVKVFINGQEVNLTDDDKVYSVETEDGSSFDITVKGDSNSDTQVDIKDKK